jgi:class 3 adenylate cyclase
MDAPPIQYARTSDGVSIAYWVAGSGARLLHLPHFPYTHIDLELAVPPRRLWYEALTEQLQLIRYDPRGLGLSSEVAGEVSLDGLAEDAGAVIRAVGGPVSLFATGAGVITAVRVVRDHPELVERLVLWRPVTRDQVWGDERLAAIEQLMQVDWEAWADSLAFLSAGGWRRPDTGSALAEVVRRGLSPEGLAAWGAALQSGDVLAEARAVEVPTLVLTRSEETASARVYGSGASRLFAAAMPNSTLRTLPGDEPVIWTASSDLSNAVEVMAARSDLSNTVAVIADFIRNEAAESREAARPADPGLQTILFTDLEASTALTQRLGDAPAHEVLRGHNAAVRGALETHGGREVKHTGDGIMAAFSSAVAAVSAALEIQRELAGGEVRVRAGLNAGEPIAEDGDLFGAAVQLAARITDRAEPGQVLVSRVVADLCAGKGFDFASLGEVTLKGIAAPVALFEVRG